MANKPPLKPGGKTKRCPKCGKQVPASAKSCPNCGYKF